MALAKDQSLEYSTRILCSWCQALQLGSSASFHSISFYVYLPRPYLINWPTGVLQETVQKPSQNKNVNYAEPVDTLQHFRACITTLSPWRFNVVLKTNSLQFHYAERKIHCFASSLPIHSLLHYGLLSPFPGAKCTAVLNRVVRWASKLLSLLKKIRPVNQVLIYNQVQ